MTNNENAEFRIIRYVNETVGWKLDGDYPSYYTRAEANALLKELKLMQPKVIRDKTNFK